MIQRLLSIDKHKCNSVSHSLYFLIFPAGGSREFCTKNRTEIVQVYENPDCRKVVLILGEKSDII